MVVSLGSVSYYCSGCSPRTDKHTEDLGININETFWSVKMNKKKQKQNAEYVKWFFKQIYYFKCP